MVITEKGGGDASLGDGAVEVWLMGYTAVSFDWQRGHAVKEVDFINCNTVCIGPPGMNKAKANLKIISMSSNPYFYLGPETIWGGICTNGIKDSEEVQLLVIHEWPYDRIDPRKEKVEIEVAHCRGVLVSWRKELCHGTRHLAQGAASYSAHLIIDWLQEDKVA